VNIRRDADGNIGIGRIPSDTPRTDAQVEYDDRSIPLVNFARQLEREVAALKADAERWRYVKQFFRTMGAHMDGQHTWAFHHSIARMRGPTIDAAIDAAKTGTPPSM
jgi:hypothetical protein